MTDTHDDKPSATPRKWRVKAADGEDLIEFWRTFKPASNEVLACDIIEELEREFEVRTQMVCVCDC